MPFVLAPVVSQQARGLWSEGNPYSKERIYDLCSANPDTPPVNYDSHILKPHSICHFDAPSHIIADGASIDSLMKKNPEIFFGWAEVLNLGRPNFEPHPVARQIHHWEVGIETLKRSIGNRPTPKKILLTFDGLSADFYTASDRALTLSVEAARWLTSAREFNLLGTPWRSVDFQPGSRARPIHKALFKNAGVLECLNMEGVPAGKYFISAFPIPLESASESPVCPVLFAESEFSSP